VLDFIFSNDDPNFMISKYTTMEKLIHAFHMHTVWIKAMPFYKIASYTAPKLAEICNCLLDMKNNGIYYHLAMLFREFKGSKETKGKSMSRYGQDFWWHGVVGGIFSQSEKVNTF